MTKKSIRKLSLFIIGIFLVFSAQAAKTRSPIEWQKRLKYYQNLKESEIDISRISLELTQEFFPLLNIEGYLTKIDKMANEVRALVGGKTDPDYRIRALNTYFYQKHNFRYDRSDPFIEKAENRHIIGPIDKEIGNCSSLAVLYVAVAQKLGYPVYAVAAPMHFFVRYADPSLKKQNIEPTSRGRYLSDSSYARDFDISKSAIKNGVYLKTLNNQEFLAKLIRENAVSWADKGKYERAYQYFKIALNISPFDAHIIDNLGHAYIIKSNVALENAKQELEISKLRGANKRHREDFKRGANLEFAQSAALRQRGKSLRKKARQMGHIYISPENYRNMIIARIAKKGNSGSRLRVY